MEKLKHKNVLEYYGCESSEEDGLFLFLQLCEYGCLSNFLQKKHLTEAQALEFLKQIVEGMAYINSKGMDKVMQEFFIEISNPIIYSSPRTINSKQLILEQQSSLKAIPKSHIADAPLFIQLPKCMFLRNILNSEENTIKNAMFLALAIFCTKC